MIILELSWWTARNQQVASSRTLWMFYRLSTLSAELWWIVLTVCLTEPVFTWNLNHCTSLGMLSCLHYSAWKDLPTHESIPGIPTDTHGKMGNVWALHTFTLCLLMVKRMLPAASHWTTLISWWDKAYSWSISKKKGSFLLTWYFSTYFITQNKKRVKAWTKRKINSVFLFLYEAFINKHCHIKDLIKYDTLYYCVY